MLRLKLGYISRVIDDSWAEPWLATSRERQKEFCTIGGNHLEPVLRCHCKEVFCTILEFLNLLKRKKHSMRAWDLGARKWEFMNQKFLVGIRHDFTPQWGRQHPWIQRTLVIMGLVSNRIWKCLVPIDLKEISPAGHLPGLNMYMGVVSKKRKPWGRW